MSLFLLSTAGTVLILAVIVFRRLTLKLLPKKTFLILWGIVVIRLLIPVRLPSEFSIYSLVQRAGDLSTVWADGDPAAEDCGAVNAEAAGVLPVNYIAAAGERPGDGRTGAFSDAQFWNVAAVLKCIWMCGLSVCLLFFVRSYVKCKREFAASVPVENDFVREWIKAHRHVRTVAVRQSDRIRTPLTYGFLQPVILVPKRIDWGNRAQMEFVLTHENVHICRLDALFKWVLLLAVCVHWFNPFVWVMYALCNRDIELSCDEEVLRILGEERRAEYADILISMEEKKSGFMPLYNSFSENATEERIMAIMKIKKKAVWRGALACVLVTGICAVFATNAKAAAGSENRKSNDVLVQNAKETADGAIKGDEWSRFLEEIEGRRITECHADEEENLHNCRWDEGETFALTDEQFLKVCPPVMVEYWTVEEYEAWLEVKKVELQGKLGELIWGYPDTQVWTQEDIDAEIARYEADLQKLKDGWSISKTINGELSYDVYVIYTSPEEILCAPLD